MKTTGASIFWSNAVTWKASGPDLKLSSRTASFARSGVIDWINHACAVTPAIWSIAYEREPYSSNISHMR
ncbi:MAG: hypothetical protein H7301_12455 [Cryobacterium sp.]|nr:hypothetical protein [Oligoflexia bacterium]